MKYLFIVLFSAMIFTIQAQESKQFVIDGKVKKPLTINLASLNNYKSISIDSMTVYNHLMQRKGSIKKVKGILLKDILNGVEIISESPKKLNEYYIVCKANDDYKVVYSWNEIFNTPMGDLVMILTSYETDPEKTQGGNIAMISPTDRATGRRFMKGLSSITIFQVN
ncbi:molybdopterin-binding protein [Pedobacter sp. UYP24]